MRFSTATALGFAFVGSALAAPGVEPASVVKTADPGSSFDVDKIVNTPEVVPQPDIVLLVDITGSMGPAISNIKTNLANVISTVKSSQPTARFAVASFGDIAEPDAFQVVQGLSDDVAALQAAVNSLTANDGGDWPEDWINALGELATGAVTFRDESSRVIVLVGDAFSHDPSGGHTLIEATAALLAENIRVIAVDVGGIDEVGQATAVTSATGGVIVDSSSDNVSNAIVSGIKTLDVDVTPEIVSCDAGLTLEFDPVETKVPSGTAATFKETVKVAANAEEGATLHCSVRFLLNGAPGGDDFIQSVTVTVNIVTPPTSTYSTSTGYPTSAYPTGSAYPTSAYPASAYPTTSAYPTGHPAGSCKARRSRKRAQYAGL